jgi:hypothetical protein
VKVEQPVDGTIIITYDSSRLTKLLLGAVPLILCVAAYDVFVGTGGTDRLIGLLASAGTCVAIGIVFLETTWFEFAGATRILRQEEGTQPGGGETTSRATDSSLEIRPGLKGATLPAERSSRRSFCCC